MEELMELIKDMDIPLNRREDLHWLARNLSIRNSKHSNFQKAKGKIKELLNIK